MQLHCIWLRKLVPLVLFSTLMACNPSSEDQKSSSAGQAPTLYFSAIPDQNTTELKEKFEPLATYLSGVLGIPVEYRPVHDYQASVELFKNGDIHLAWFGGLTGVQARDAVPGARAIAQGDTDPHFYSYFIAHRDTGLERSEILPADLHRFKFTFGSPSSTSGRLMPELFLREATGKSPEEYFEHPVGFSGSHDKTVEIVEAGRYEVGVVNFSVYDRRVAEGTTDPTICRVIWVTPEYADYNWSVRPDVDAKWGSGFVDRLQAALVGIEEPALLSALPRQRLIRAENQDFDGIRQVASLLEMLR